MYEVLLLLLPLAALWGWYAARGGREKYRARWVSKKLPAGYFKGISYLGSEQPDKAIETFIKVLEVDSDTVETHLALGNLYRRRGEMDRAIRIHRNLIAWSTLRPDQRAEAMLELGRDYMSAGLLDRAEDLFRGLRDDQTHGVAALRQLIEIYEREKEWDSAIGAAARLEETSSETLGPVIAHYYCEQAERYQRTQEPDRALQAVHQALTLQPGSVRASLLKGDLLAQQGDWIGALDAYRRVEAQDGDFLPEAIPRVCTCLRRLGRIDDIKVFLDDLLQRYGGITAALALAEYEHQEHGEQAAIRVLTEQLHRRPSLRGCQRLLEIALPGTSGATQERLLILKRLLTALLAERPVYRCQHCGFPARSLHWQCPGCRQWSSIRSIQGIEGE